MIDQNRLLILFYFFSFYVKSSFIAKASVKMKLCKPQPSTNEKAASNFIFEA